MQREYTIDFLKFFAAILITNSHIDVYEPLYRLSTGGSIGDILFFFCSGYAIFLGRLRRFDNWYKRRLTRIFPPVVCWGILAVFLFTKDLTISETIINGGGWFVQCILIYYILAYPIRKYASQHITPLFTVVVLIVCLWFLGMDKDDNFMLYGWNYCKWAVFFLFFLQGALLGLRRDKLYSRLSFSKSFMCLLGSTLCWYGILYLQQSLHLTVLAQLITVVPLLGISYFFFRWCGCELMKKIFINKYLHPVIRGFGGLCFEIYLVQNTIFHFTHIPVEYPFNIPLLWFVIIFWAYILHVFTNFVVQTVRDQDYDWKAIIKIY